MRDAELHLTRQTAGNGIVTYQTFDANTGQLTGITAGDAAKVQSHTYTYDLLGKLLTRSDGNTGLSESFTYDTLNRLTSSTVSLTPTPWVQTVTYNAIGNMLSKSDVGTYSYPAPGQARPHGVTSISGGTISTTFQYDAKGNMTSGNGLTIAYTAFNKPATITRGTTTIAFGHDPEHQRFSQLSPAGNTLYLHGGGVFAERFAGIGGGGVQWTNYLIVGGRLVGVHIQKADETTATRYFHTDHLGSISVITNETGGLVERLSYDAWGKRRQPDGTPDPAGAITSESNRGFTGHEQLDSVGLIHMNGRVYDPLLARFGTPDPMTESPFSTQGWNRYSYVGNSPVNFTDPSGYCFMGCFWKPMFAAIGKFFQQNWRAILQIAVTAACNMTPLAGPACAAIGSFVSGITSGNLGQALRGAAIAFFTAAAFTAVGDAFPSGSLGNIAGHAVVGCLSAVAGGGKCGPGALSAGVTSFLGPMINGRGFSVQSLVANAVVGGLASVAGGGRFANGAVTSAFGYLFNQSWHDRDRIRPEGSQEQIDLINDALGRLCMNSETACRLLEDLRSGSGEVRIRVTDGRNRYSRDTWTVYWNPDTILMYDGSEPWMRVPNEIVLAHELIHAFRDLRGLAKYGFFENLVSRVEEMETVGLVGNSPFTENKIRQDYKLPLRPRY